MSRQNCFCSHTNVLEVEPIDASHCYIPCNGNPAESCGGSTALDVYAFNSTGGPFFSCDGWWGWRWTEPEARLSPAPPPTKGKDCVYDLQGEFPTSTCYQQCTNC